MVDDRRSTDLHFRPPLGGFERAERRLREDGVIRHDVATTARPGLCVRHEFVGREFANRRCPMEFTVLDDDAGLPETTRGFHVLEAPAAGTN